MRLTVNPKFAIGYMPCCRRMGQWELALFAKSTWQLRPGAPALAAEKPDFVSGDLYADDNPEGELLYPSDFAPFKPRADVLIRGTAWAAGGKPAPTLFANIRVGRLTKSVKVIGDRAWRPGFSGSTPGEPKPFVSMPLTWDRAYGGPGFARNPRGLGREGPQAPNLEDPARPVRGPRDGHDPAGFGPIPLSWPQRQELVGTYKGNWLEQRWPWFPKDFDWGFFNAAPRDQQIDGYLRGDEDLEFQHLHPKLATLRARLPGIRVRAFLTERLPSRATRFREVPLALDTLWIDLDAMKMILVWRGVAEVRTFKFREIEELQVVNEPLSERPLRPEYYQTAPAAAAPTAAVAAADIPTGPDLEPELAELQKQLADMEKEIAALNAEGERMIVEVRAQAARNGSKADIPGWNDVSSPMPFADVQAAIAGLAAQFQTKDPKLAEELARLDIGEAERVEKEMGALEGELDKLEVETPEFGPNWTRDAVAAAAAAGESLAEQDLRELDLSGLNLARADLTRAILVKANLAGTNLSGARLVGADLSGANLADADLSGADVSRGDLTGAVMAGVRVKNLTMTAATLAGLDLAGADFSGAAGADANFAKAILAGARFAGAALARANFTGCDLSGANFAGAALPAAQMYGVQAAGINLEDADATGLQASEEAVFTRGNFRNLNGDGAIFETSQLDQADFTRARLARAQFGDASLVQAVFDRARLGKAVFDDAVLTRAVFTSADLKQASFDRADLREANLEGANCYDAGFWLAATESARLQNANLKNTRLA